MARTVTVIFEQMLAAKEAEPALATLTSTSKVALWRAMLYIAAVGIWAVESLFDIHVIQTKETLTKEKPGRPDWYGEKAKAYQHGFSLVPDQDYYDNTGVDESLIEASKVIKHAVAVDVGNELRIKIAGLSGGSLAPITGPQFAGFQAYMQKIKFGGVDLGFTNSVADSLKLAYKIYYDPQVLDATGKRLDGTNDTPVQNAINDYLINGIAFNGYFVTSDLTTLLEGVNGVSVASVTLVQTSYGLLPFANVIDMVQPDAGYLRIYPGNLSLTFIATPL